MPTCLYTQPLLRLHGSEADRAAGWELFSMTSGRRQEERRREETIGEESRAEDLMLARTLCPVPIWNWCPNAAVELSRASAHTHTPSHCCCFLPPLLSVSSHKHTGSVWSCSSNWQRSHLRWRSTTRRLDPNSRRWGLVHGMPKRFTCLRPGLKKALLWHKVGTKLKKLNPWPHLSTRMAFALNQNLYARILWSRGKKHMCKSCLFIVTSQPHGSAMSDLTHFSA